VSEWQPIETAPKDGTRIVGLWPAKTVDQFETGIVLYEECVWIEKGDEVSAPTFWTHLPEPPK
jgi:hypothetical protein